MWKHRPHPRTSESESAFLQNCSSLLGEVNLKKYLYFELTMPFPAKTCIQLIINDISTILNIHSLYLSLHFKDFIYLFLERRKGREKESEINMGVWEKHPSVASHMLPARDLALHPVVCPCQELNQQPFGSQAGTQSTEPHKPVLSLHFKGYFSET